MSEFTQEQLEEMVEGKPQKPRAVFFEKARLDVEASKREGHRVYKDTVYVRLTQSGVTDSIAYRATPHDIAAYPEEYQYFTQNRQGVRDTVPISIIPNLALAHMQELTDIGLGDVRTLAEAEAVPPHLEYARKSAITLNAVLQEQRHGNEENHREEEDRVEEGREAAPLPPADRPEHATPIGRPELPRSVRPENEEAAEVASPGGQEHRRAKRPAVTPGYNNSIDNWDVELNWRP